MRFPPRFFICGWNISRKHEPDTAPPSSTNPSFPVNPRTRTDWLLLAGFCIFLFFYGLGQFGLLGADEPRYAQVAREMLERHDWITPTLGGKVWLEKPVLYYWQAMLAYRVFGVTDWAARLPSALDASLMVLGVYFFLRRLRPGFHLDGALITASAAGVVGFAHAASPDMSLAATFTLAMLAWYAWWETSQRLCLAAFYLLLALATLAKGPVAPVLAGAIVALFAIAARRPRIILTTLWIPGMLLFFLIALPWYVAVQIRNPEFFRVFILEHNFARFGSNLYHHRQPFWFYIPVALLALLPWTVAMVTGFVEIVRAWWAERTASFDTGDALNVFLILWLTVPVLFFSLSQSKLPGYILPALPAGTLLVAEYLRQHAEDEGPPAMWMVGLHALICATLPALTVWYFLHYVALGTTSTIAACLIALIFLVGITVTLRSKLGLRMFRFVTLIAVVVTIGAAIKIGAAQLDGRLSARPLAIQLAQMETRVLPVAVFGVKRETEYGLAFYRNQRISRYESHGIPSEEHLLITPEGARDAIGQFVGSRRVAHLGTLTTQGLEYYWVAGTRPSN
jgi:4-amino-4-deoxy-L-arabinose transferase-like glycosyltransferase